MEQTAYIDIVDIDGQQTTDSKRNDIAFYTTFQDQKILFTSGSNTISKLAITSNNIGIGTVNPRVKLDINSKDAVQFPVGTYIDRNSFSNNWNVGQVRYNSSINQFEGYQSNNWKSLGGVIDANSDTFIIAEISQGINNDQLQFYTSNLQRMIVDSNGFVGIGNTVPATSLHVTGNITGSTINIPRIVIGRDYSTNIIATNFTSNNNNIFYVDGNVGIGTTAPQYKLDVGGLLHINSNLIIENGNIGIGTLISNEKLHIYSSNAKIRLQDTVASNNFTTLDFYNSSNLNGYVGYFGTSNLRLFNTMGTGSVKLYTSNTERLIVDSVGNIGIGTVNPLNKLHVLGDGQFTSNLIIGGVTTLNSNLVISGSNTLTTGIGNINISGVTTLLSNLGVSGVTTLSSNLGVSGITTLLSNLNVTGTTTFSNNVFLTSGNIGIGTLIPSEKLHIYGSNSMIRIQDSRLSNINIQLDFYSLSNLNGYVGYSNSQDLLLNNSASNGSLRLYTSNTERLTILNGGNIGIGTNNPISSLHVYGQRNFTPTIAGIHIGHSGTIDRYGIEICASNSPSADAILDFTTVGTDSLGRVAYNFINNEMVLNTNNSTKLTINASGLYVAPQHKISFDNGSQTAFGVPGSVSGTKLLLFSGGTNSTSTTTPNAANDYSLGVGTASDLWHNVPSGSKNSFTNAGTEIASINSSGINLNPPYVLNLGSASTRQMINLYGNGVSGAGNYGIGVQAGTTYFRSGAGSFSWFKNGVHSDSTNDPGSGGTSLMSLNTAGGLSVAENLNAPNGSVLCVNGFFSGASIQNSGTFTGNYVSVNSGQLGSVFLSRGLGTQGLSIQWNAASQYSINGQTVFINGQGLGTGGWEWQAANSALTITNGAMFLSQGGDLRINGANATKASGTTWINPSDIRIKTDVTLADYDRCYEIMSNLDLKRYKYRDDIEKFDTSNMNDKTRLGWIAQEVELYYPKAIVESDQYGISNLKSLDVDQIYACMYGTIKKLIKENEDLKININEINSKLNVLYSAYTSNM